MSSTTPWAERCSRPGRPDSTRCSSRCRGRGRRSGTPRAWRTGSPHAHARARPCGTATGSGSAIWRCCGSTRRPSACPRPTGVRPWFPVSRCGPGTAAGTARPSPIYGSPPSTAPSVTSTARPRAWRSAPATAAARCGARRTEPWSDSSPRISCRRAIPAGPRFRTARSTWSDAAGRFPGSRSRPSCGPSASSPRRVPSPPIRTTPPSACS